MISIYFSFIAIGFYDSFILTGGRMFANKTFANKTFANGESPGNILAKVQWTFANWRNSRGCIGESTVDFRPIGESEVDYLSCHGTILI